MPLASSIERPASNPPCSPSGQSGISSRPYSAAVLQFARVASVRRRLFPHRCPARGRYAVSFNQAICSSALGDRRCAGRDGLARDGDRGRSTARAVGPLNLRRRRADRRVAESITPAPEFGDAELVAEVRIVGNDTTTTTQISANITTRAGRPFDGGRAARRRASWPISAGSSTSSRCTKRRRKAAIVIFQVVERPTIRYVTYLGNEGVKDKTLDKQTGLKAGGSVDPYAVRGRQPQAARLLPSKGYNNVQITILEGNKPTDQGVIYLINEGAAQRIWKTSSSSATRFVSDGRLKTLIKSKPPILYAVQGLRRPRADRRRHRSCSPPTTAPIGYFQARVSRQLEYNDEGNWIDLTFVIHEGPQYQVRDVSVIGNTKFEPAPLAENVEADRRPVVRAGQDAKDAQWLQELYGSQG